MTEFSLLHHPPHARQPVSGRWLRHRTRAALRSLCDLISAWHHRAVTRRYLREMEPRMLRDIGLTPSDAQQEARKPWWRA